MLKQSCKRMAGLQERLYAQDRWSVLLIFQAMDAAGKDGTIKHVMSGVNPQGCDVHSFKAPSTEELDHDFLWRTNRARCRAAATSASSIARTTRRRSSCACTRTSSRRQQLPRGARHQEHLARALRRHQRLRALPVAAGRAGAQVLPARLEGRTAQALPRAARRSPRSTGSSRRPTSASARTSPPTWRPTKT